MFFYLWQYLSKQTAGTEWESTFSGLRLFRYITFRSAGAAMSSLLMSLWLGPGVIAWLKELNFGQNYRDRAEVAGNLTSREPRKMGTPTMGGLLIIVTLNVSTLLWAQWNTLVVLTLLSAVVLCGLGFYDDYLKITKANSGGAKSRIKVWVQGLLGLSIGLYLWYLPSTSKLITEVMVPFYKHPVLSGAGGVGLALTVLTIMGSSNAVNLTDGLDGLAIGCTSIVSFVFLVITYVAGNVKIAAYLEIPFVPGAGELTVLCAAMFGGSLGFLWYNCHPAQVFMGDTGSLALGGALGIVAVLVHQPVVLVIAGGVFVMEAVSVILQTSYFRFTRKRYGAGRRLFLMAPIHHHFERKNWHETQVVMRFYILCILFAMMALSSLKIR
jgi:phospho-N-acetylmuramoyl-pentapeptide-transferase